MEAQSRAVLAAIATHGFKLVRIPYDIDIPIDTRTLADCLNYLEGHSLIRFGGEGDLSSRVALPAWVKMTSKGIDITKTSGRIADKVNVVSVTLSPETLETLQSLLLQALEQANAPPSMRQQILDELKAQPAKVMVMLLTEALGALIGS